MKKKIARLNSMTRAMNLTKSATLDLFLSLSEVYLGLPNHYELLKSYLKATQTNLHLRNTYNSYNGSHTDPETGSTYFQDNQIEIQHLLRKLEIDARRDTCPLVAHDNLNLHQ